MDTIKTILVTRKSDGKDAAPVRINEADFDKKLHTEVEEKAAE